ncbi:MAG: hypothetical protein ACI9FG_001768 [Crocinitomicaceae bacterium]|jgi:hypothetical protein
MRHWIAYNSHSVILKITMPAVIPTKAVARERSSIITSSKVKTAIGDGKIDEHKREDERRGKRPPSGGGRAPRD